MTKMDEAKKKYYGIWSSVSHKFVFGIKEQIWQV
jgi:hypothetical protein